MAREINLTIEQLTSEHALPLYEESQGQEGSAYLYLDTRDGEVYVRGIHPAYANSWGVDEHNGHVRKWRIPNNLTVQGYNSLLSEQKLRELLERVYQGAEEYYDGNNYRTKLTEDAIEASETLNDYLHDINGDFESLEPWDAWMWLEQSSYIDLVRDGESHEDAAQRLHAEAMREGKYCSAANIEVTLDEMKKRAED